jgi:hypothetical protein
MYEAEMISRGEEKVRRRTVVVVVRRKGVRRRSPFFIPDDAPGARTSPVIIILRGVGEISGPF